VLVADVVVVIWEICVVVAVVSLEAVVSPEVTDVVRQRGFAVVLGLVLDLVDEVVVCCEVAFSKDEVSGKRLLLIRYVY